MPDFGDEVADFFWREFQNGGRKFIEWSERKVSNMVNPFKRDKDPNSEAINKLTETMKRMSETQTELTNAFLAGKSSSFDFTDGKANTFVVHLDYLGKDPQVQEKAYKILVKELEKNGFPEDRLVPIKESKEEWLTDSEGKKHSFTNVVDTYNYSFTFSDSPEEIAGAQKFLESYQKELFLDPDIAKTQNLDEFYLDVQGFGLLNDGERQDFLEAVHKEFDRLELSRDFLGVSQFDNGDLAGNLSLKVLPGDDSSCRAIDSVIDRWNEVHQGQPEKLLNSFACLEDSSQSVVAFDEKIETLNRISEEILAEGLDVKCFITKNGQFIIDATDCENISGLRECLENYTNRVRFMAQNETKDISSFKLLDGRDLGKQKIQDRIKQIKEAKEVLAQQGIEVYAPTKGPELPHAASEIAR